MTDDLLRLPAARAYAAWAASQPDEHPVWSKEPIRPSEWERLSDSERTAWMRAAYAVIEWMQAQGG
jgi:hypothetical protein